MLLTAGSFEALPPGIYQGEVTRIEQDQSKFDGKPQLVFTVRTTPLYGEKIECSILYWTSTSFSPQLKLGGVYIAVIGEEVGDSLTIDTGLDLLNQRALNIMSGKTAKPEAVSALGKR